MRQILNDSNLIIPQVQHLKEKLTFQALKFLDIPILNPQSFKTYVFLKVFDFVNTSVHHINSLVYLRNEFDFLNHLGGVVVLVIIFAS